MSIWEHLVGLVEADDGPAITAWAAGQAQHPPPELAGWGEDDPERRTLLMLAYWEGRACAAGALINAGANYHQRDAYRRDASWYARHFGGGERQRVLSTDMANRVTRISMEKVIKAAAGEVQGAEPRARRRRWSTGI
jgi:hypothetical protein